MKQNVSKKTGFTIVEMVVVVAIIGTLAAIGLIGWRTWQQSAAQRQVQSDIKQAAIAMDSAKNFSSGYPLALPNTYQSDSGVTVTYFGGNTNGYCIQAQSVRVTSVTYYIDSTRGGEPFVGTCSSSPNFALSAPGGVAVSALSSASIMVSWTNSANATGYTVRYGTASPTTIANCTSSPCTITGLAGSTLYRANVTATNSFTSAASGTVTATTPAAIAAPTAPSVTYTSSLKGGGSRTYNITASGGACTLPATTEWKFFITATQSGDPVALPNWNTVSWQTANTTTYTQVTNGFQAPGAVTVYAKPRCVNGVNSTEYSSYATYP
jgi:prepilin-type N-terminal cleavage/methylation domain-containing protein